MDSLINRRIYDSDDENWKERLWRNIKIKGCQNTTKRKKEAANIVVRPTLSRVSILAKPNDTYIPNTH